MQHNTHDKSAQPFQLLDIKVAVLLSGECIEFLCVEAWWVILQEDRC